MSINLEDGEESGGKGGQKKPPAEKKTPGRPTNDAKANERKGTISSEIEELGKWIEMKDPELGKALKDGAERMAKVLSARASKHARVARAVDVVFAKDGPLAILRGFGPTMRLLGERLGARRDRNEEVLVDTDGFLLDPQTGLQILNAAGAPIHHSGSDA